MLARIARRTGLCRRTSDNIRIGSREYLEESTIGSQLMVSFSFHKASEAPHHW